MKKMYFISQCHTWPAKTNISVLPSGIKPTNTEVDRKQSLSGQSRGCAHSPARLERGEINEKRLEELFLLLSPPFPFFPPLPKPPSARSLQFLGAWQFHATSRLFRKGLLAG